jgi:hypothetical protein
MIDRAILLRVLIDFKNPHKVLENGRGGYRCAAGDFESDWTLAEHKRIVAPVKGFLADEIIAACGSAQT